MAYFSGNSILLSVGTRDGLYIMEGDSRRQEWRTRGPYLSGLDIHHAILDARGGRTVYAAGTGDGQTAIYRSEDRGETWQMSGDPFDAEHVWHVEPSTEHEPDVVYAGVAPAALYRSSNRGDTWAEMTELTSHYTREEWEGGGGGLCLHTIVTNPHEPQKLAVGISAVGWFVSEDSGKSWDTRNNGVASFSEEFAREFGKIIKFSEIHNCVHKAVRHPSNGLLYQQNHGGVYKSENYGVDWIDISDGLPNRFGFVIGITNDGTVYVVPQHDWEEEIGVRMTGQLTVCRRRHGSDSWEHLTNGLPEVSNMTLYREGMATDQCSPGGVYFGTSDGNLFGTVDGGDSWTTLANDLPSIRSVSCEHYTV